MKEEFRILIFISRRSVKLFYKEAGTRTERFPGEWMMPLVLMHSDATVTLGSAAAKAAAMGNPDTVTDFFNVITTPRRIPLGAGYVERSQLLLLGLEEKFRDLFDRVFFGAKGTLESNRATMPLLLLTAPDLKTNEVNFLRAQLHDAGYMRLRHLHADAEIARCIDASGKAVLLANSYGTDLHLTLLPPSGMMRQISLPGLGVDPRVDKVADMIWEDAQYCVVDPDRELEIELLRAEARDFLQSGDSQRTGEIRLHDGSVADYFVTRPPVYGVDTEVNMRVSRSIEKLLAEAGYADRNAVKLARWGVTANNDYFKSLLQDGFADAVEQNSELTSAVLNYLGGVPISTPAPPRRADEELPAPTPVAAPPVRKPMPAHPAGETVWSRNDMLQMKRLVVPAYASMQSGNRERVAALYDDMKSVADGRPWPSEKDCDAAGVKIPGMESRIKEIEDYMKRPSARPLPPLPPLSTQPSLRKPVSASVPPPLPPRHPRTTPPPLPGTMKNSAATPLPPPPYYPKNKK